MPAILYRAATVDLYISLLRHGNATAAAIVPANPVMLRMSRPSVTLKKSGINAYIAVSPTQAILKTTIALIGVCVLRFTFPIHSGRILSNDIATITLVPPSVMFVNHIQNQA